MTGGFPEDRLERVLDGIETIERSLGVLAQKRETTDRESYKSNSDTRDVVERRFVKMTEAAIDIGKTIVIYEVGEPPGSNPKTMSVLGELGILSEELAADMAGATRFRNVLAHTYGDAIDHDVVFNALADLERYRRFVVAVSEYLESAGAFEE